jgi:transcriptional regulator with XRE-family HTH domain
VGRVLECVAVVKVDSAQILHDLGERVRVRRHELGLSQEVLAEHAGLHRNYIGGIEQGRRNVAAVNLVRLAIALEIDPGELLAGLP